MELCVLWSEKTKTDILPMNTSTTFLDHTGTDTVLLFSLEEILIKCMLIIPKQGFCRNTCKQELLCMKKYMKKYII